jgi:hypothetical protein
MAEEKRLHGIALYSAAIKSVFSSASKYVTGLAPGLGEREAMIPICGAVDKVFVACHEWVTSSPGL